MDSQVAEQRRAALDNLKFKRNNRPTNTNNSSNTSQASSSVVSSSSTTLSSAWTPSAPPAQSRDGAASMARSRYFPPPPPPSEGTGRVLVPNSSPLGPSSSGAHHPVDDGEIPGLSYGHSSVTPPRARGTAPSQDPLSKPSGFVGAPSRTIAGTVRPRESLGSDSSSAEPARKRPNLGSTPSSAAIAAQDSPDSPEIRRPGQRRAAAGTTAANRHALPPPAATPTPPRATRATAAAAPTPPPSKHAKGQRSPEEEKKFNMWRMEFIVYETAKVEAAWVAGAGDPKAAASFINNPAWKWKAAPPPPRTAATPSSAAATPARPADNSDPPSPPAPGEGRNRELEEKAARERAAAKERGKKSAIYAGRTALASPDDAQARREEATRAQQRAASPESPEVRTRLRKRARRLVASDDEEDDAPTPVAEAPPTRLKRRVVMSEEPEEVDDNAVEPEPEIEVSVPVPVSRSTAKTDALRALEYFNTQSAELLRELTGCSDLQAAKIVELRPFKNVADLRERLGQGKKKAGPAKISPSMFEDCVEIFEGYSAVDNVLDQCEDIGADLQRRIARWTGAGKASQADGQGDGDAWGNGALSLREVAAAATSKDFLSRQPKAIKEGVTLKEYQLLGLNWLRLMHQLRHSAILADEMGLGKTIQVISLFAHLHDTGNYGPHLVCVPSSTLENWVREFSKFAPGIMVQTYYGSKDERAELRQTLLETMGRDKKGGWEVLVTTYNVASSDNLDKKFMRKIEWDSAVFDEGHMLKNCDSLKYKALIRFGGNWKLLLTGTPLQNNLQELVSLMNFIHPSILGPEMEALRAVFKTKGDSKVALLAKNRVSRAKRMMTPFVLRRRKDQVLKDLPKKLERIEWCDMTPTQRRLYDEAVARSRKTALELAPPAGEDAPAAPAAKKKAPSKAKEKKYLENSSNVLMDLRKASSHPMLFRVHFSDAVLGKISKALVREDDYKKYKPSELFEELQYWSDMELQRTCFLYKALAAHILEPDCLYTSGKLLRLLELIEQYRGEGRKILVFSQFVQNLDILTAVLDHKGTKHLILTGQTPVDQRQALCDEFTEDEDIPVFLLSTKAGGMGINLVAASVVILFDQDFNPHNDRQAQDRAYRIGQRRDVDVIKLITRESIEEDMLRLGQTKLALDRAVAGAEDDAGEEAGENVEKQLKTSLVEMLRKQAKGGEASQAPA